MQVGRRFGRREILKHALEYLIGLLRPLARKNGWQLAEASYHATPYKMQYFLARARWEADTVRDSDRLPSIRHLPLSILFIFRRESIKVRPN